MDSDVDTRTGKAISDLVVGGDLTLDEGATQQMTAIVEYADGSESREHSDVRARIAGYGLGMASVVVDPGKVLEFQDEQSFYRWLGKHWDKEKEIWIKIHKVRSGLASITPTEAIDVVLCWGWIDGIRKGFDDKSFLQRYCPRGKKSVWSEINVANVARLIAAGRMQPPGMAPVDAAKADGRWANAYSMTNTKAPSDLLAAIRAEPKAMAMYETLSAQNRFALTFRTLAMKTEAGRKQKIASLVAMLANGKTIYPNGARRIPKASKVPKPR